MASGGAGGGGGGDGGGGGGVCSWVTLATNDVYSGGALVLAQSLRDCATAHRLTVLVTPAVSPAYRQLLAAVYDEVVQVDVLDSGDVANLTLMKRPELGVTLTKLHAWTLTQYCKCVFLDADCLVVSQCDELFDRDEISAAVDIGWPDCFNSGVFVFTPSHDTFRALIRLAETTGSFDGGDQGLLNEYFSGWSTGPAAKRLSFLYNMVISATYTCSTAFKRFGADVKIVHFLGSQKPWLSEYPQAPAGPVSEQFHQQWHQLYRSHVLPALRNQPEDPQTVSEYERHTSSSAAAAPVLCISSPHSATPNFVSVTPGHWRSGAVVNCRSATRWHLPPPSAAAAAVSHMSPASIVTTIAASPGAAAVAVAASSGFTATTANTTTTTTSSSSSNSGSSCCSTIDVASLQQCHAAGDELVANHRCLSAPLTLQVGSHTATATAIRHHHHHQQHHHQQQQQHQCLSDCRRHSVNTPVTVSSAATRVCRNCLGIPFTTTGAATAATAATNCLQCHSGCGNSDSDSCWCSGGGGGGEGAVSASVQYGARSAACTDGDNAAVGSCCCCCCVSVTGKRSGDTLAKERRGVPLAEDRTWETHGISERATLFNTPTHCDGSCLGDTLSSQELLTNRYGICSVALERKKSQYFVKPNPEFAHGRGDNNWHECSSDYSVSQCILCGSKLVSHHPASSQESDHSPILPSTHHPTLSPDLVDRVRLASEKDQRTTRRGRGRGRGRGRSGQWAARLRYGSRHSASCSLRPGLSVTVCVSRVSGAVSLLATVLPHCPGLRLTVANSAAPSAALSTSSSAALSSNPFAVVLSPGGDGRGGGVRPARRRRRCKSLLLAAGCAAVVTATAATPPLLIAARRRRRSLAATAATSAALLLCPDYSSLRRRVCSRCADTVAATSDQQQQQQEQQHQLYEGEEVQGSSDSSNGEEKTVGEEFVRRCRQECRGGPGAYCSCPRCCHLVANCSSPQQEQDKAEMEEQFDKLEQDQSPRRYCFDHVWRQICCSLSDPQPPQPSPPSPTAAAVSLPPATLPGDPALSAAASPPHAHQHLGRQCRDRRGRGRGRGRGPQCSVAPPEQPPPQPDQVELLTPTVEQLQLQDKTEQAERRRAWEYGQPDYMGADRFDTILAKIDRTISGADSSH